MREAVGVVDVVNLVLFVFTAFVAVRQWRSSRGNRSSGLWAALAFLTLGIVVLSGQVLPERPENAVETVAQRIDVALLVLFPFFLYRFTIAFAPSAARLERFVGTLTTALVLATFALPSFPGEGDPRPWWFVVYLVAFVAHWSLLLIVVAARLWRSARDEASVARLRMRTLALASVAIIAAIVVAAIGPRPDSAGALLAGLLATLSGVAFLAGLAPPAVLRLLWRRPEQARTQAAIMGLMTASSEADVVARVAEPMARTVGARAIAIYDTDDRVIGSFGLERGEPVDAQDVSTLAFPFGRLVVWTTAFAPYFGDEELKLLRTLGSLTGVALDRARLFAREVEAREALERADELKSQFVALAAHELRSPVTTIYGLSETIAERGPELEPERLRQLQDSLREQIARMRDLVGQLLDLSRLEAAAVEIHPQAVLVEEQLRRIVAGAVPLKAGEVSIEVDPSLEAQVDGDAFERIVSNLVANAFRYGAPPVVIRAQRSEGTLHVIVEDRGHGVPPEFVPQLFERFARSPATASATEGTGLGLAIARSYARAHHGDLSYSRSAQGGASFEVVLRPEAA